jgi:hypothetical protein
MKGRVRDRDACSYKQAGRSKGPTASLRSSCSKDDGLLQDQRVELGHPIIGDRVREAWAPGEWSIACATISHRSSSLAAVLRALGKWSFAPCSSFRDNLRASCGE